MNQRKKISGEKKVSSRRSYQKRSPRKPSPGVVKGGRRKTPPMSQDTLSFPDVSFPKNFLFYSPKFRLWFVLKNFWSKFTFWVFLLRWHASYLFYRLIVVRMPLFFILWWDRLYDHALFAIMALKGKISFLVGKLCFLRFLWRRGGLRRVRR